MSLSSLATADDISLLSVDISNPDASINLSGCYSDKKISSDIAVNVIESTEDTEEKKNATCSQVPYIPAYRGLTAQIGSIPSISCDNSLPLSYEPEPNSKGPFGGMEV